MEQWMSFFWSIMGMVAFLRSVLPQEVLVAIEGYKQRILEHWVFLKSEEHRVEVHENCSSYFPNELYTCLHLYLRTLNLNADTLLAECPRANSSTIAMSLAPEQCVQDTFQGIALRWQHTVLKGEVNTGSEHRHYTLSLPKAQKQLVAPYLEHVLQRGRLLELQDREKQLFTNMDDYWDSVPFTPPANIDTLAMEDSTRDLLLKDLSAFKQDGSYYSRVGKAWKRGYLLYGPPGTGKSTLIGAMANYTGYDVYDLELTKVPSNRELRRLLMNIKDRAIVVVEDIDCTVKLGNRKKSKDKKKPKQEQEQGDEGITLSGLLNFTDGLWSSCGKERIFVFTTNYVDDLDPALIRPGRMDMHIAMSFCTFSMFKSLVRIVLEAQDDEAAALFYPQIEQLLKEIKATPADVSETLARHKSDTRQALANLVEHLQHKASQTDDDGSSQNGTTTDEDENENENSNEDENEDENN